VDKPVTIALFAEEAAATRCAEVLRENYNEVYICRPIAGGAEVTI